MGALSIHVTGRVQGVGFRYHAAREAARLGLVGWVRNEPDGSVLAHAEGPDSAVAQFVAWCGAGPAYARVRGVTTVPVTPVGGTEFALTY